MVRINRPYLLTASSGENHEACNRESSDTVTHDSASLTQVTAAGEPLSNLQTFKHQGVGPRPTTHKLLRNARARHRDLLASLENLRAGVASAVLAGGPTLPTQGTGHTRLNGSLPWRRPRAGRDPPSSAHGVGGG